MFKWNLSKIRPNVSVHMNKTLLGIFQQTNNCFIVSKVGGPSIGAAHKGLKLGGPRPARPNSFRRLFTGITYTPNYIIRMLTLSRMKHQE